MASSPSLVATPRRRSGPALGRRTVILAGLAVSCVGALLWGCGGESRTPIVVYSPHGRDLLTVVEQAFEQSHPDLDVRWLDMGSQEVLERIRSERANPQADVWFGGPSILFARAASQGYLEPLQVSWTSSLAPELHDRDDRFAALYLTPTLIVYNQETVARDQAPQDWDDLLLPTWKDRILIRDPLASGTMRTIFGYLLTRGMDNGQSLDQSVESGFEFLQALDAQTKEYVHSPALLHEKIIRQEGSITVWEMTDILGLRSRGAPLESLFPSSGSPVIEDSVALVAGGKHTDAARIFVDWLGQQEALLLAAREAYRLPARPDVTGLPEWVDQVRRELVTATVQWSLLEEYGAEWMSRWDQEVRGRNR